MFLLFQGLVCRPKLEEAVKEIEESLQKVFKGEPRTWLENKINSLMSTFAILMHREHDLLLWAILKPYGPAVLKKIGSNVSRSMCSFIYWLAEVVSIVRLFTNIKSTSIDRSFICKSRILIEKDFHINVFIRTP